jgi:hypothetical protein
MTTRRTLILNDLALGSAGLLGAWRDALPYLQEDPA